MRGRRKTLKPETSKTERNILKAGQRTVLLVFLFLIFSAGISFASRADTVNLSVTYGYQNTAKAGHYLPLKIGIENTGEDTFSGFIHVYMAASEDNLYEYRYQKTVEGSSAGELDVTVSLSTGVSQLLITAEDRNGTVLGSKRIGLDVAGADAELIIGLLSDQSESLSYLNGVGINDGILKTRTVALDAAKLPSEAADLDQLDVLLISDYTMESMKQNEADAIMRWVGSGGTLLIGTGKLGGKALAPYFSDLLKADLSPMPSKVDMISTSSEKDDLSVQQNGGSTGDANAPAGGSAAAQQVALTSSAVYLRDGRVVLFSGAAPIVSEVSVGAGLIAVSGYDFCDLQRYATEQSAYVDILLTKILGQSRLEKLSVTASEKSLNEYWDIQELMNVSDARRIAHPEFYAFALFFYLLLIGPGLYFYMREHGAERNYRPSVLIVAVLSTILIWVMGIGTRFNGRFLTYAKLKDVSETSIDEKDFINLRSSYRKTYGLDVRTEYYAYPVLKGSDYNGDITSLSSNTDMEKTAIDFGRDKISIEISNADPFTAKYFELDNKIPNSQGAFTSDLTLHDGAVSGSIRNDTSESLQDAAVLIYGKLVRIGKLEAGATVDLSNHEPVNVPVGEAGTAAALVTSAAGQSFLRYYLANELNGYFQDAKLVGFVRDESPGFTEDGEIDSYGITMVVSALPLNTHVNAQYSYSALSRDPEVLSGDYTASGNTISGSLTTEIRYHLGEDSKIEKIRFDSLNQELLNSVSAETDVVPFRGSISFYNYSTGGFDPIDPGEDGILEKEELTPYLGAGNLLEVRYTAKDQNGSPAERSYLPMLVVTADE